VALVIDHETGHAGLQALSLGRDLSGSLARALVLPGFLLLAATGIAMTLLRYGRRPPAWVWIKVGLNMVTLLIAPRLVAPYLAAARTWAHWSLAHNQLAPQFLESAARASFYGAVVFTFFLLNIPVAIWKPYASIRFPRRKIQPPDTHEGHNGIPKEARLPRPPTARGGNHQGL
jgi:hypothetical protein